MSTHTADVNLAEYTFALECSRNCGRPATVYAKGCMDKEPVPLCDVCVVRGLDVIRKYVHLYQRFNKRVLICGDCFRPIIALETHLEIVRIAL